MARGRTRSVSLEFAFFTPLWEFYDQNRGRIRQHYRALTKKYLDYNDPTNARSFLRQPQFEALEMYVFLKEFMDNEPVHEIFRAWAERSGRFQGRADARVTGEQLSLLEYWTQEQYDEVFSRMRSTARVYPNYIFALTMGTGKTILMATCIFYEFILANKFPTDAKYCHNALVFAPDKTVLESLREIQTFDKSLVVPPEYINWLNTNIRFHFLEEAGTTLDTLDKSRFNLVISNTQKIILKRQSREKSPIEKLLGSGKPTYERGSVYDEFSDLYGFDEPEDESDLATNQRFEKLRRLEQLGIYIDEAHHAFGRNLARDVGAVKDTRKTSLRLTVDELAGSLKQAGTRVVACYNYTGTPYVGQEILPEVVYAFGLQEAIDEKYLKLAEIHGYTNPRSSEFVDFVIDDFMAHNELDDRHEGMRPKIAFFAATIDELQHELQPAVEDALAKRGVPADKVLVNVGDPKLTTSDDIREFNRLDTAGSGKQFILLVNKGREGWNCRSLFGVALFRKPQSRIFVLQATMRCLRSIGDGQQTGRVYLSDENMQILHDELEQNFRVTVDEISGRGQDRELVKVRVNRPPVKVKLRRVRRLFSVREKEMAAGTALELAKADTEKYRLIHRVQEGLVGRDAARVRTEDLSHARERRQFSELTLVAEVARYLNKPCLEVEEILRDTAEGIGAIISAVNEFNELLYDWVIPRLFQELYDIDDYEKHEEYEVELVRIPDEGYYEVTADKDKIVRQTDAAVRPFAEKSFHLDAYCFDSGPERDLFWRFIRDGRVNKLYFTGMLTHGQSDFYVQYIDPESHTVRTYYPDLLLQKDDGSWVIVEVKGDNKIDDPVVQAKAEFASQMAIASGMTYSTMKGSECKGGDYSFVFRGEARPEAGPGLL